ncbi:RHS repeat-associated core domain-containing protein [Streptomyces clavifer]|uniref:RHS repeat-associated core domain-containing protein n=1 Tax=Streptomyces clavifer TaxID=68188 RepID=UPI00365E6554
MPGAGRRVAGRAGLQLPLDGRAPVAQDSDDNGTPRVGQPASRYAWRGGRQRSAETLTGLSLMRGRLYNGSTGRFLQTDPVFGGSCNAYDYGCADPANTLTCDKRRIIVDQKLIGSTRRGCSGHAGL